jgi:membrane protein implicated in regulation of membrane protease activity
LPQSTLVENPAGHRAGGQADEPGGNARTAAEPDGAVAIQSKGFAMQWMFLVLALSAALAELHSGTFYLAGVAAAALVAAIMGFWIRGDLLIFAFVVLCAILTAAVMLRRRHQARTDGLADFDIGQTVTVCDAPPHGNHLTVSYRGVNWQAVMEDGSVPAPGSAAIIKRKTDKLLHLASPLRGGSDLNS